MQQDTPSITGAEQAIAKTAASVRRELWSLQYLRATAAIAVVVFHCTQTTPTLEVLSHGVDLFFVISGFIIVALTQSRTISSLRFFADRVARIAPTYWLATTLTFLAVRQGVNVYGASGSFWLLTKSLLFIPSDNGHGHIWPELYLGWTLNFEMFFYVVFAFALLAGNGRRLLVLTGTLMTAVTVGLIFRPSNAILFVYTDLNLLEFLSGAWLGALFGINLVPRPLPKLAALVSASGLVVLLLLGPTSGVALYGGASVILVAGSLMLERASMMPRVRTLKFLGDASFAIYLFQQLAFSAVGMLWTVLEAHVGYHVRGQSFLNVLAAVIIGSLMFAFVERPLGRWTRALLRELFRTRIVRGDVRT